MKDPCDDCATPDDECPGRGGCTRAIIFEADLATRHINPRGPAPEKCRSENCYRPGLEAHGGYCLACFNAMDQDERKTIMPPSQQGKKICARADCRHGGEPQPVKSFHKCATASDGLFSYCKDCVAERDRTRREKKLSSRPKSLPRFSNAQEIFVRRECEAAGVSYDLFINNRARTQDLVDFRARVADAFRKHFDTSRAEAAEAFGVSDFTIRSWEKRLQRPGSAAIAPEAAKEAPAPQIPETTHKAADKVSSAARTMDRTPDDKPVLLLDFRKYRGGEALYAQLLRLAEEQVRSPEAQVFFFLKNEKRLQVGALPAPK